MECSRPSLKLPFIACSIPGAIIVLVATIGAWLHWGDLSFSNPLYYATLAVAAWCPLSKLVVWRFWRRKVETCWACVPAKAVRSRLSPSASAKRFSRLLTLFKSKEVLKVSDEQR